MFNTSNAQQLCSTADTLSNDTIIDLTFYSGQSDLWVTFTPNNQYNTVDIYADANFNGFSSISVYTGDCSNLINYTTITSLDSNNVNIVFSIYDVEHYIKLIRNDDSDNEEIILQSTTPLPPYSTSPIGCNMISNPIFEILNPNAAPNVILGNFPFRDNIFTDWQNAWGSPNVIPTGNWDPNVNHATYLWSWINGTYGGEGIFQDVSDLVNGNRYRLVADIRDGDLFCEPLFIAAFTNEYTPVTSPGHGDPKPIDYQEIFVISGTGALPNLSGTLQTYQFPVFTFNNSYYYDQQNQIARLTLYNKSVVSQQCAHQGYYYSAIVIDDIILEPAEELVVTKSYVSPCSKRIEVSLTGNYQNVDYSWTATVTGTPTQISGTGHYVEIPQSDLPATVTFTALYHDNDCVAEKVVNVSNNIQGVITIPPLELCLPDNISGTLVPQVLAGDPPYYYYWDDPNTYLNDINSATPLFTATSPGFYTISLIVVDANGCVFEGLAEIYVVEDEFEKPVIEGKKSICEELPVIYSYSVTNPDPDVLYTWSFNPPTLDADFVNGVNTGVTVEIEFINPLPVLPATPQYINLEVVGASGTDCEKTGAYRIYGCCDYGDFIHIADTELDQNWFNNGDYIYFEGVLEVTSNISITNNNLYMGPEAKIVVHPGAELEIDLNSSTTHKTINQMCSVMWDGIYVVDITSKVTLANTTVSDAINVIVSKNGGDFLVENCIFENNYIGIDVMDYNASTPNYQAVLPHPGQVMSTTFESTNSQNNYELDYIPKQGERIFCGIRANMIESLTIGDHSYNKNEFKNMEYGIWSRNSSLKIVNNHFENIRALSSSSYCPFPYPLSPPLPRDAAIYSFYDFGLPTNFPIPASSRSLIVGEQHASSSNTFTNCSRGICGINLKIGIENNDMNGLDIEGVSAVNIGQSSYVKENELFDMQTGIRLEDLYAKGIQLDVEGNSISDVFKGIHATNIGSYQPYGPAPPSGVHNYLLVYNNTIVPYRAGSPNKVRAAINVNRCPYAIISCNLISLPASPSVADKEIYRGIWVSQTQHAFINDNKISDLGSGIYTTGIQTNSTYFCNIFQDGVHAFFFGQGTLLTNQGYTTPSNGGWNTHNWFNQNERLQTVIPNIVNPNMIYWYTFDHSSYYQLLTNNLSPVNSFVMEITNNGGGHACDPHSNCPYSNPVVIDSNLTPDERDMLFANIINMKEIYLQYDDEYRQYNAEYLYSILTEDSTLMFLGGELDGEYQYFYDSLRNEPASAFLEVEKLYNDGDWHEAWQVNQAITPNTAVDEYRQTVNNIFFSTWCMQEQSLTTEDSAALWAIALLNPYEGGFGVYTARILLGIDPEDHGVSYRQPAAFEPNVEQTVRLYPNPARGVITVEFLEEVDLHKCVIEFYSIHGQRYKAIPITELYQTLSIGFLPNGMHFFRIINDGKVEATGKLIVKP